MESSPAPDFLISSMRILSLPEITFFHVSSQPTPFNSLDAVLDPLIEALYQARKLALITEAGPDIVRYYRTSAAENSPYIMEVGIAVNPAVQPAGAAQVRQLAGYPCAGMLLWGGLTHIAQAYESLMQAMNQAGLRHTGEVRECTYSFESPTSPNNLMGIYMGIG